MAKRDEKQAEERDASQNGHDEDVAKYEKDLAKYLQERIKPNLNSGAIPLLARSIAKDIASRPRPNGNGASEASEESKSEKGDEQPQQTDLEADMHEFQAELGEDWILSFSVHGDDAWLTAEKEDKTQHVEAPTAEVLADAVELLTQGGGRSG